MDQRKGRKHDAINNPGDMTDRDHHKFKRQCIKSQSLSAQKFTNEEIIYIVGNKIQDRKVIEVKFPSDPEYEEEVYYDDEEVPVEEDPEEECDDEASEIDCEEEYEEEGYEEEEYEEEEYEGEEDETTVRFNIVDIEDLQ